MCYKRLDLKETMPSGMERYLQTYGWHFSKRMCEYAVSKMRRAKDKPRYQPMTKDEVDAILHTYGIDLEGSVQYDYVYVANMARCDFGCELLTDDQQIALFVKSYIDDADGYDEVAFTRYYADCIGKGEQPMWEDMI